MKTYITFNQLTSMRGIDGSMEIIRDGEFLRMQYNFKNSKVAYSAEVFYKKDGKWFGKHWATNKFTKKRVCIEKQLSDNDFFVKACKKFERHEKLEKLLCD